MSGPEARDQLPSSLVHPYTRTTDRQFLYTVWRIWMAAGRHCDATNRIWPATSWGRRQNDAANSFLCTIKRLS